MTTTVIVLVVAVIVTAVVACGRQTSRRQVRRKCCSYRDGRLFRTATLAATTVTVVRYAESILTMAVVPIVMVIRIGMEIVMAGGVAVVMVR